MSAGSRNSGWVAQTARCDTPLSIQTSMVSLRFVVPGGRSNWRASSASLSSNQTFEPPFATRSARRRIESALRIIHRRENRKTILGSERVIVFTMPGRHVHRSGAGVHRDKIGRQYHGGPGEEGMLRAESFEFCAGK